MDQKGISILDFYSFKM